MNTINPFGRPLYVMLKPVGARCNLNCSYCYYLEKAKLYPEAKRELMSEELLERFVREYIESQTMDDVLFTWHGGEPLLRPLPFYKKVMQLQQQYGRGRRIANALQTNGTLLNEEWCRFLHENHWLVGISIDGPEDFHDEYRLNQGHKPTFQSVMRGINLLKRFDVEWNAMAVVNDYNADYPLEFYHFFKQIGCQYLQFTPIVERLVQHSDGRHLADLNDKDAPMAPFSVAPRQWGDFLCTVFDEWVQHDVGQVYVQLFDATLANWMGVEPGICTMARHCGHAAVMEHNGDVYSCDHFVFPEYLLGNIHDRTLTEMLYGEQQQRFSELKRNALPRQCRECQWNFACNGECPRNRFCHSRDGEPGQNYLCQGYSKFFTHVAPYMDFMREQLQHQQAPANVMQAIRDGRLPKPCLS